MELIIVYVLVAVAVTIGLVIQKLRFNQMSDSERAAEIERQKEFNRELPLKIMLALLIIGALYLGAYVLIGPGSHNSGIR